MIGNKILIKRDILNLKLKNQQHKSLEKTGAPIEKCK
jgi:hypothetical protein